MIDEEVERKKALREGVGGDIWRGTKGIKRIIYFNSTFLSLNLHTREDTFKIAQAIQLLTVNALGSNSRCMGY